MKCTVPALGARRLQSRWATSGEQQHARQQHRHAMHAVASAAAGGPTSARDLLSGVGMQRHYLAALDAEDPTGYLAAAPNSDDSVRNGVRPQDSSARGQIIGPTPVDALLDWLASPPGRRTYVQRTEIAWGRKERWHRVVGDVGDGSGGGDAAAKSNAGAAGFDVVAGDDESPDSAATDSARRQLVDSLWRYICDAEVATRKARHAARKARRKAQWRAQQNAAWLRKMVDASTSTPDPVEADRRMCQIFLCEWPERPFLRTTRDGSATDDGDGDLDTAEASALADAGGAVRGKLAATTSADGATTPTANELDGGNNDADKTDIQKEHEREVELRRSLNKFMRKHGMRSHKMREGSETGSDSVPFAPYEDLPFLRQRFAEDPDALDPALKDWAEKNLVRTADKADAAESSDGNIKAGSGGEDSANAAADKKRKRSENAGAAAGGGRAPRAEALLYLPAQRRIAARRPTFDEEGLYFHVDAPSASSSSSPSSSLIADEHNHATRGEDRFVAADLSRMGWTDQDRSSSGGSDPASAPQHNLPQRRILSRSFFKPRMVRARDDTSRGVVKIDWPTVRAAYGSRAKTDLSREEVAAARERIMRLCRGEDPSGL